MILATDNDGPGQALAEELSRRIGTYKCWKVCWPNDYKSTILPLEQRDAQFETEEMENNDRWFRKDANEVLIKDSIEVLKAYSYNATPFPIQGLHTSNL